MATQAQVKAFINLIAPSVRMKCTEHGWGVPSAIIAQAGIESAWGTSGLWKKAFNLCGQKWVAGNSRGYVEMQTKEQRKDGSYYTVLAKFVKYTDVLDAVQGYFEFIEKYKKRYTPVIQATDFLTYASQLSKCGWATSLSYSTNIINTVNKYMLTQYDLNVSTNPADRTKFYAPGQTYTTQVNLFIRDNAGGNKIKYDNITRDGKANAYFDSYGHAILRNNTRVTCKEVIEKDHAIWMRIPSGWICCITQSNEVYVK